MELDRRWWRGPRLRLCLVKDCPGACTGLHLCKNVLLTGSCPFTRTRTGCRFSHFLDSPHNAEKLTEHGLESLTRSELCTLLLQNDTWLLPQICHNYNNGGGRLGLCQEGDNCTRLHICEKYLNSVCSCIKNHDFNAPQPQKSLSDCGVPDQLFSLVDVCLCQPAGSEVRRQTGRWGQPPTANTQRPLRC
ncbi:Protein mono-ADP-ribosyltransferase PARP12 [Dissostichus eleginoides]|uniref:Protein mono-ADP-ribosyltransferase PARP12 n=1 Tax=Dissostichus eleginoides TaxID=100907 RepID=A0AAD9FM06_DISEL|nr:Protein mono-ADP-ribosyltransferase PARP12 [Dissostichus eleginoides]